MYIHKNWFTYLALSIFLTGIGFALISTIGSIGSETEYPFLWQGTVLLILLLVWIGINIIFFLGAWLKINRWKIHKIVELIVVLLVLAGAAFSRLWVIKNLPMQPLSDFQTYYNISDMLVRGVLREQGVGYCQYITQFPHVIGYPFILSLVFKMFGTSVLNGLYFGFAVSMLSVLLTYRIAKNIGGRLGGLIALMIAAFWPSQILFINQMASEPLFSCMLLFCIYIVTKLLKDDDFENTNMTLYGFSHLFLGVMIAITSAIRPMAIILLIAILICVLGSKIVIKDPVQDKAVLLRGLSKGWIRCLLIICGFLITSTIINNKIEQTINSELPGATVSFGYNLLVGLNIDSKGAWNAEDAKILSDAFNVRGSAKEAHTLCRDIAFERVKKDLIGEANLIFEKYTLLWKNDDYGSTWNLLFLEQQGNLTDARKSLLYDIMSFNNIYYSVCLFFSAISGVFLWRKKGSPAQILVLLFIGTAVIHMLVESQNRYHYQMLPLFTILAAFGIADIFRSYCTAKETTLVEVAKKIIEEAENEAAASITNQQDPIVKETKSSSRFDMMKTIKEGHVIVTVSEAYLKENPNNKQVVKNKYNKGSTSNILRMIELEDEYQREEYEKNDMGKG